MKKSKASFGVYSEGEMRVMSSIHRLKGAIFKPILWVLNGLGLNANILSVTSGVVAFGALLGAIYFEKPHYFLVGIWLHMLIDGFDGSLARYQKKNSLLGSFIDATCDHVGIVSASVYLIYFDVAAPISVLLYTVFYTLVNYHAFLVGTLKEPYRFVLRPRILIYAAFTVDFIWETAITSPSLWFISVVLLISTFEGFWKLGVILKENF